MDLLNKLTIKNLKLNKKRTIVTIIGIILSVALLTAVATMYSSGITSLIEYEKKQEGDFHVVFYNVPKKEIDTFKNNRSIKTINLTTNIGYAKLNESKNKNKPYAYIKGFTKESLENLSIRLIDGKLPSNNKELLIPTHLKTNGRIELKVGDIITLDVGKRVKDNEELFQYNFYEDNEEIIDTKKVQYKIVGIIERPSFNIENNDAPGYTFITYIDEEDIEKTANVYAKYTDKGTHNYIEVTANILGINPSIFKKLYSYQTPFEEIQELQNLDEVKNKKYDIDMNTYLIDLQIDPLGERTVGSLSYVVGIVCAIIVIASIFCIKNSFDISITEKTKQYGMLRSIGATKKQIRRNVFYEATILGIIGIPIGLLLGFLASYILIIVSNILLNGLTNGQFLILSYSPFAFLIAVLLGIVTIYLSAFKSAIRASLISPIDSIRNSGNIKIKKNKIKAPKIVDKLFGIGGEISYKNFKRNKKKYRTTIISIVVSVTIFISLSYFITSAFSTLSREHEIKEYNIELYVIQKNNNYMDKIEEVTKLDNINKYSISYYDVLEIPNPKFNDYYPKYYEEVSDEDYYGSISIISLDDESYKKYLKQLKLDYKKYKDKAILVDQIKITSNENNKIKELYIRKFDYNENDTIEGIKRIYIENSKEELENINIDIGHVTNIQPFGFKYALYPKLIISNDLYTKLNFNKDGVDVYMESDNPNKLQDEIENIFINDDYRLSNMDQDYKTTKNLFILLSIFLYGFIIVISLIGITNIFNTITTNVELRKQEFAMLKSIGMTKKEFNRMIRLESLFIGGKSLILGTIFGLGLSYLMYVKLVKESEIQFIPPYLSIILCIIVVFLLIFILMKYSLSKINKQNTIETIRNENI